MQVQAKFRVAEIHHHGKEYASVKLRPVSADSEENKTWSRYTPSGELTMDVTNPAAIAAFEIEAEYLLTFSKVEAVAVTG